MNHAIKLLEQEKIMLEKILKPYKFNIEKGFNVPIEGMKLYEERLNDIKQALSLITT